MLVRMFPKSAHVLRLLALRLPEAGSGFLLRKGTGRFGIAVMADSDIADIAARVLRKC